MPMKVNSTTSPLSLNATNTPTNGQIPAYNDGQFEWVTKDTGEAITLLSDFIEDTKRVGMTDRNQTSVPYLTDDNTLHLDDMGDGWNYYVNGARVEQSGNKDITFDISSSGIKWFYINDDTGEIKVKDTTVDFGSEVAIAYCLINSTISSGQKCLVGDERHTTDWDSSLHVQQHLAEGTKKIDGGVLSGYTLYSGTDSHKQYNISQSVIYDEDIRLTLDSLEGGNGKYTNFYRTSSGVWGWQLNANFPYIYTTSSRMNYDNATANGVQSPTNRFLNTYVLLTNLTGQSRHITITSQTTYETYGEALGESLIDLNLTGLSIPEFVCIYKITWYTDDSISGTGKCYIYNVQDYSVNSIDVALGNDYNGLFANTIQVTPNGNDTTADGSLQRPFKTIQKAIDKSLAGNYIQVGSGQFNENITIASKNNLFIQGLGNTDSYASVVNSSGSLTVSGTTTRARFRDIQLSGKLTINGAEGRHYFDNVYFGQGADFINAFQRWSEFTYCTINGNINIGVSGTPVAGTSIRFRNCTFTNCTITVSSPNVTVTFDDCRGIKLVHSAGTVIFLNENTFLKDGNGNSIVSTATNSSPTNVLIMNGCNFQQTDLSFGKINKTGSAPYILGNSNRDVANDTLTGLRLGYVRNATDIGLLSIEGLSATNIQDAIAELKSLIDSI
jgi:hypothetical protein